MRNISRSIPFYAALVTALATVSLVVCDLRAEDKPAAGAIRINAGATSQWTDSAGNVWAKDEGFKDGESVERDSTTKIANTKDAPIYLSEHYGMTEFSKAVPNGKYAVKLHFAETSGAVTANGERVFTIDVEGNELKDFDPMAKAGAKEKAYIETVNVEVKDGKLDIKFTAKTQNPAINGIEIIPAP